MGGGVASTRPALENDERLLRVDLTDAASDLSTSPELNAETEFRGLSAFKLPGILDRKDLKERDEP